MHLYSEVFDTSSKRYLRYYVMQSLKLLSNLNETLRQFFEKLSIMKLDYMSCCSMGILEDNHAYVTTDEHDVTFPTTLTQNQEG
jgi:hypothetical protein